jgi:hypothetical protein
MDKTAQGFAKYAGTRKHTSRDQQIHHHRFRKFPLNTHTVYSDRVGRMATDATKDRIVEPSHRLY